MIDTTTFTPWTLFTDMGFLMALMLIGKVIRVYVKFIQKLFIPPSLIAGLLGLALGPNGFDIIPFSENLGTYAAIMIAMVFGALPLASPKFEAKEVAKRVGPMWGFAQFGMLFQWGAAALFGVLVLNFIWPELNSAFGVMVSTGFYGGHGTAAAIGDAFDNLGWDEARSLSMTTATVGVMSAILGGLVLVKWAAHKKQTSFISDFNDLPNELRSGLMPEGKRESAGEITVSPISIESITLHLSMITVVAFLGYMASLGVKQIAPGLELPVFSCAFIVGLILKKFFDKAGASTYICPKTTSQIGSSCTDILVACGVASIKLGVVVKYAIPLIALILFGIFVVWLSSIVVGRWLFKKYWFERSIFAWGWWSGTMAMGIALLRIADPKMQSKAMEDYALGYLPIAPVEILLITLVPVAFVNGQGLLFGLVCLGASLVVLAIAKAMTRKSGEEK